MLPLRLQLVRLLRLLADPAANRAAALRTSILGTVACASAGASAQTALLLLPLLLPLGSWCVWLLLLQASYGSAAAAAAAAALPAELSPAPLRAADSVLWL
jgi:hypothetical protein